MTAEVRDYQVRIINKALKFYNEGDRSVLVNSPTGSGKSFVGLEIVRRLQREYNIGVAWVAMRRNLLKQALVENEKLGVYAEITPLSMFSNHLPTTDSWGRPIQMVCLDEASHDCVDSMAFIYNTLKPRYILGLSATPFRTDSLRLSFDRTIRDIGIYQLISLGYLSEYDSYIVPRWDAAELAAMYLREPERWGKSIFYFLTHAEAELCASLLRAGGIPTEAVTATTDRDAQLDKFESGELRCLTNMFILTEGFNSVTLKTVFVRDSQKGPTTQMAGRVLRKCPSIARKQIVQSSGTHWPFQKTALPKFSYLWMDNEWRSYELSPHIEKVATASMMMLAQNNTELPTYIQQKMAKKERRPHRRPRVSFGSQ